MNGKSIAALGAVLVAGGGIALYFAYESGGFAAAASAWAAILLGAVLLMSGLARHMSGFLGPARGEDTIAGQTEIQLLIQSMGSMAMADGRIAQEEIATISAVHEQMLGITIADAEIRGILDEISQDFDIASRLEDARPQLSQAMRQIIVKSCYLVMAADRIEHRTENAKIHEIGTALGFQEDQVADLIAAAST